MEKQHLMELQLQQSDPAFHSATRDILLDELNQQAHDNAQEDHEINDLSISQTCLFWTNIGSNTALIAPIKIGKEAIVGAGSSLTSNVKNKSLALTRAKQIEIKNYKRK